MLAKVLEHEAVPTRVQYTIFHRSPGPHFQPRRASQCERALAGVVVVVAVAVVVVVPMVEGGQVRLVPKGGRQSGGSAVRTSRQFLQS